VIPVITTIGWTGLSPEAPGEVFVSVIVDPFVLAGVQVRQQG